MAGGEENDPPRGKRRAPSTKRLVVDPDRIDGDRALITGGDYHHLKRVMRRALGDAVELADGVGGTYVGKIVADTGHAMTIEIHQVVRDIEHSRPRLTLVYGLARSGRTELVLQKATELGVDRFVPAVCERSVARPQQIAKKLQRWQEVARQAARQCGRTHLPTIEPLAPLPTTLSLDGVDLGLIAHGAAEVGLAAHAEAIRRSTREVLLLVGPEGGFTPRELEQARRAGFAPVSLGSSILRTETAAIALLSIVAHLAGRLG